LKLLLDRREEGYVFPTNAMVKAWTFEKWGYNLAGKAFMAV